MSHDWPTDHRVILHVDMDAFYASVEERENPSLVGQPLVVGGKPTGRGVVAAANYAAREFGIHSAMSAAEALRRCPQVTFVRPRLEFYSEISREIRKVFCNYTPQVEPLSLDEAFLDVTGCQHLFGSGEEIANRVKADILRETGLIASVGVAPNKFLAKLGSDLDKPNGLVIVDPDRVQAFLDPLPVGRIWGVGQTTTRVFDRLGVRTIEDLRRLGPTRLTQEFGQLGDRFWRLSRGLDDRPVIPDREAKSISHETTFSQNISEVEALRAWLRELSDHVGRRLREHNLRGRTVQIKVRYGDFHTVTRSKSLPQATNTTRTIWQTAATLLGDALTTRCESVRLLGVGVTNFAKSETQRTLFADEPDERQRQLDSVADELREKFGKTALRSASVLLHQANHRPEPKPERL